MKPTMQTTGVVAARGLARKSMGGAALWFFDVAASAPMTVLAGGVVTTYASGWRPPPLRPDDGVVGLPVAFGLLAAVLALLSVGYVAMARHVGHAATFYALLTQGLGRPVGVAGGLLAVAAYNAIQISLYGLLGATLAGLAGGPWWVYAAAALVGVAVLGPLRNTGVAGVLAVLLVFEIGVIVLFDVGALLHPAQGEISVEALAPARLHGPAVGGVLAFGIACYVGYESGPAYGEEARTRRAVGRATFAALAFLGVFYTLSAWALTVAVGPGQVAQAAHDDPNLVVTLLARTAGPLAGWAATLFLVTSIVAAQLSFHSGVARYLFALGRERVLPGWLAVTGSGARRDAPTRGSLVQTASAGVVVAAFAVAGADPQATLFIWLAASAAVGVLVLLVAASLAALLWFRDGGGAQESAWARVLAPTVAIVAGTGVLVTTVVNLDSLLGAQPGSPATVAIPGAVAAVALAGLGWALILRYRRPQVYAGVGRGRPHPLDLPDQRLAELLV